MIFLSTGCSPVLKREKGRLAGQSVWSDRLVRVTFERGPADRTVVHRLFTHPRGTDGTAGRYFDQLVSGVV
jgi:hypothetical protein